MPRRNRRAEDVAKHGKLTRVGKGIGDGTLEEFFFRGSKLSP